MEVVELLRKFRSAITVDVRLLAGEECRVLAEELALTAKTCSAVGAAAAARAAECGAHREAGFVRPEDWVARTNGTSRKEASDALDTARQAKSCPPLADALVAGSLSPAQAAEIAKTEKECPGSAGQLVELAAKGDLATLKNESRKRRLAAVDPEELHRRQHGARNFRHWTGDDGMVRLSGALPPSVGVGLMNRLDAETDRIRRQARRSGSTESRDAHAADALVAMLEGSAKTRAGRAEVVFVCDLAAYRRGHAEGEEVCHIVGGGPVPVSLVHDALDHDAFVKAVLHDGVRIETVKHFGRHIPVELRTALDLGAPPDFDGTVCADGCGRRYHLQWDHRDPVANRGPTSYDNLQPLCWDCHAQKTETDRKAGLLTRPGGHDPP